MFESQSITTCHYLGLCSKLYEEDLNSQPSKAGGRGQGRNKEKGSHTPKRAESEPPTDNLLKWREAVSKTMSASQLAVCVNQLDRCLAWERSATKVVSRVTTLD